MSEVPAGLDLSKLVASAKRAPERLDGCHYDVAGRVWVPKRAMGHVPKERRKTLLKGFSYQVEMARTGQSACKRCGDKIAKGALRVGYPSKDPRGEFGALVVWLHVPCARGEAALQKFAGQGVAKMKDTVLGVDALPKTEREKLAKDLLEEDEMSTVPAEPPAIPAPRQLERHPAPPSLTVPMLPFQAEGLGWLLAREADPATRGGILADEMGMGKTLQMISLLLAGQASGPTLVVCPAAAMLQWRNEITRFTREGALEVELYYGFDRRKADLGAGRSKVVLTTYQTLEADYRREVNRCKVKCQWCERMFLPEKLGYHQKYFCGPDAQRTEKQSMTDFKSEAVKRMKIGGVETEIVLNPRSAIRTAAIAAARAAGAAARGAGRGGSSPRASAGAARGSTELIHEAVPYLPFPSAVLPEEARTALGMKKSSSSQRLAESEEAVEAAEATTPRGRGGRGRGRGHKRARVVVAEEDAPMDEAAETPDGPPMPAARKRWAKGTVAGAANIELEKEPVARAEAEVKAEDEPKVKVELESEAKPELEEKPQVKLERAATVKLEQVKSEGELKAELEQQIKMKLEQQLKPKLERDLALKLQQDPRVASEQQFKAKLEKELQKVLKKEVKLKVEQELKVKLEQVKLKHAKQTPEHVKLECKAQGEATMKPEPVHNVKLKQEPGAKFERRLKVEFEQDELKAEPKREPDTMLKVEPNLEPQLMTKREQEAKAKVEREFTVKSEPRAPTWGSLLRRPTKAIRLEDGLDSDSDIDSDIELVGLQGSGIDLLQKSFGSSSSSGSKAASPSAASPQAATKDVGQAPRGSLPPRPDSDDDEAIGGAHRIDLSPSPLLSTRWGRVVLDEAHRIKGRTNSTAQAAFALKADTRWCLSGTPLQNRVGELYALARFVRFYPYAHYFCCKKGCKCVSLHYSFDPDTSTCRKCGHTKLQHRSHFAQQISNPIKKYGFLGAGKTAMETLRTEVLDTILLRRTKEERQADIQLPPLKISIRKDKLSAEERDFYTSMYMQSRTKFDAYVEKDTLLHNYAHVFDLIIRLRQAVDHPYLIIHGSLKSENGPIPSKSCGDADVCALCQDDVSDRSTGTVALCGHAFHRECVAEYLEQAPRLPSGGIGCPTCFAPLTLSLEDPEDDDAAARDAAEEAEIAPPRRPARSILQRIKASEFTSSTKIEALVQEVTQMTEKSGTSKALVFSQFVNFLELIEWRLKREGISAAKLLGNMSVASRNNIILTFMSDPSLKVLLISLKAGGEGLNLQAADHIFLMDPWWNPASELQAIQRAHRIGQTKPVRAVRFVMADTIEEKIIELQNKKQSVFDCTVGGSNTALQRLTAEDIKFLFNQ